MSSLDRFSHGPSRRQIHLIKTSLSLHAISVSNCSDPMRDHGKWEDTVHALPTCRFFFRDDCIWEVENRSQLRVPSISSYGWLSREHGEHTDHPSLFSHLHHFFPDEAQYEEWGIPRSPGRRVYLIMICERSWEIERHRSLAPLSLLTSRPGCYGNRPFFFSLPLALSFSSLSPFLPRYTTWRDVFSSCVTPPLPSRLPI